MALRSQDFSLKLNPRNTSWLQNNAPSSPVLANAGGGGGIDWMGLGSKALAGIAGGPGGLLLSGGLGALGSFLNAREEKKAREEEMAFRRGESARDQKNTDRQFGMNAVQMMRDNYATTLTNMLRRGGR